MKFVKGLSIGLALVLMASVAWGQPWIYNFGTGTGTFTSSTASTSFLPGPPSGTARVRVGTNPGSIVLANPGLEALGTDTELQISSNTGSSSTTKFSVYDYTLGKTGYVKFSIVFSGGTNGVYNFTLGDGANFSDNNAIGTAQIFSGIRWSLGESNSITYNVLNNTTWGTTGITNPTTLFTQSTSNVYIVEVYANNSTLSEEYDRGGTAYSLAADNWDLWVNGTRVGIGLASGALANDSNIDSYAFNHQVSASAPGTIYIDDIEYSNSLPAVISEDPKINLSTGILEGFVYVHGGGPSLTQTFEVSGENLDGTDVTVTAPASFQVSSSEGSGYGASVTLTAFNGTETDIWVRLAGGLSVDNYSGNIEITGGGADQVDVAVSGSVTPVTGIFSKITSIGELTDGKYVVVNSGDAFAMNNTNAGTYFQHTAVSPDAGVLENPVPEIIWEIEVNAGGRTIYNEASATYVSYTGSSNASYAVGEVTSDEQRWTITYGSDVFIFESISVPGRLLQYNASTPRFVCYTSEQQKLLLYKLDETIDASISHEITTGNNINQEFASTNITLDFGNVSIGASVRVNKYTTSPANVSFSGSAPTNVSSYRWVINAGDLAFTGGTIKIAVEGLGGISDPSSVDIYKRSTPGTGAFTKLSTSDADGYLSASVDGFSEFILGSDDNSLPVTLSFFTAKAVKGNVVLEWETSAEVENQGFLLSREERGTSSESVVASFATDDALKGQGSTTETTKYAFTDKNVEPGKTYVYTLTDVDYSGNETELEKVEVKVEAEGAVLADGYALNPVYPNPFNATLTVPFTLTEAMTVSIELYSLTGQRMVTVVNREFGAGSYNYTVQADDLASGIYFVRTSFGGKMHMQKAVLLK